MLECPNCHDTYKHPQILNCQHTLCQSCVDEVRAGNEVKCPACGTHSHVDDVRRDINKEQLLQVCQTEPEAAGSHSERQTKEEVSD